MTPIEAVQLLDRVTAQIPMNRNDHKAVLEAIRVLTGIVAEKKPE